MKRIIVYCAIVLVGCSSERSDWDSGARAQQSYREEQQQEKVQTVNEQFPTVDQSTENAQPF
jgi:PBP1b-binding outer membrane lipoprotein LpoB